MLEHGSSAERIVRGKGGELPLALQGALGVLPLVPLELALGAFVGAVHRRYPDIADRLGEHATKRYAIDPVDCPFVFLLEPRPERPRIRVAFSLTGIDWDARMAGPLLILMGLLEGVYDGDALFFSRHLTVEGDTEAVVALRNAIEDASIDPADAIGHATGLAALLAALIRPVLSTARRQLGAPAETLAASMRR